MKKSKAAKLYWFNYTAKKRYAESLKKKTLLGTLKSKYESLKKKLWS
jgi:hypothetical protein